MSRDDLLRLLDASADDAAAVCASALRTSADEVDLPSPDRVPVRRHTLLQIYRRRAVQARQAAVAALGLDETVAALEQTRHDELQLVVVEGPEGAPWCVVFLSPDLTELICVVAALSGTARSGA